MQIDDCGHVRYTYNVRLLKYVLIDFEANIIFKESHYPIDNCTIFFFNESRASHGLVTSFI